MDWYKNYVGLFLCLVCKVNYLPCIYFATMSNERPYQHDGAHGDDKDGDSIVMSNSQGVFLASNNSKNQLFRLMWFGLTVGGTPVFGDLDVEPWNSIKKRDIKPSRIYLERRSFAKADMTEADQKRPIDKIVSLSMPTSLQEVEYLSL